MSCLYILLLLNCLLLSFRANPKMIENLKNRNKNKNTKTQN